MIPRTLGQIADITGGRLSSPEAAGVLVNGSVVTDSREAGAGSLYVARVGEHANGHRYTGSAAHNGAVAALVTEPVEELPYVIVEDVQESFAALATSLIDSQRDTLTVIGITGSSGKTTTKDILADVLARIGPTVANTGSLNSEVGVPLTVARITPETRFLVLEMGARGIGHVRYLADMTHPALGVVLNVGSAHLGEFGSRETIALAKSELPGSLPEGGLAVLNDDDDLVTAMPVPDGVATLRFGTGESADVRGSQIHVRSDGCPSFMLSIGSESVPVDLGLMGEHQVWNALAAASVATWAGMPVPELAQALAAARPASRYRMERHDRADGVTVINDAYNANPESMSAAVRTLAVMAGDDDARRRTVVALGEMLELGESSEREHRAIGQLAARLGVDAVMAVGSGSNVEALASGAAAESLPGSRELSVYRAADVDEAEARLTDVIEDGDLVLVKSSHGAGLWQLGERLVNGGRSE